MFLCVFFSPREGPCETQNKLEGAPWEVQNGHFGNGFEPFLGLGRPWAVWRPNTGVQGAKSIVFDSVCMQNGLNRVSGPQSQVPEVRKPNAEWAKTGNEGTITSVLGQKTHSEWAKSGIGATIASA